ncbi:MAG: response regulator [Fibrobacteres bacterium]|nr:response regulator [Fibrobacterota bacterium]
MAVSKGRILLVDDEPDLLDVLGEFLEDIGYSVATAGDGLAALEVLDKDSNFDLLLSDINMPRMKGFELLAEARKKYPKLKSALITAYDINSYIELAQKHNIGNIISKTSPFNFTDFRANVDGWVTGDIFGLDRHFGSEADKGRLTLTHSRQIEAAIQELFALHVAHPKAERVKTALREIVVNAVYYGARQEDGAKKDDWVIDVELQPDEYVYIDWAADKDKIGIAINDQKGKLRKSDVLFWLERNISRDPATGLVKSLEDEHGRGLFITREFIDSLIINIIPEKRTEVILINYLKDKYKGFKPLIINELS